MASGFFLGGMAPGISQGANAISNDMQLSALANLQVAQQQQNQKHADYMKLRSDLVTHLGETITQLKNAHPGWTDLQVASNPAVVGLKNTLSGFDKNLKLPDTADSIIAGLVAGPSQIQTEAALARAKEGPQHEALVQSEIEKNKALTQSYNPINPDLDVDTQLGGNPNNRVAQGFGALETGASPSPAAKATDRGSTILNNLAKQSGLLPEALDAAGRAWAGGNTSVLSNFGRGRQGAAQLSAIKQWGLYSLAHDNKLTPQQSADQLNFNTQNFAGQKAAQTTVGRRAGSFALAESEFEQVSDLVTEASKNVPRTQYKSINDVMNAWREGSGDPNIVQLGAAINSAVNVYSRAISPTGTPTVSDKDHAREILQKGWSNGQVDAAIAQLKKEVAAAKRSIPAAQQTLRGQSGGTEGAGVTVHGFTFTPTGQ